MKQIIFFLVVIACGKLSFAQCGKKTVLSSSQTEYLDSNNNLQRTEVEKSVVEINKSEVIIIPGNEDHKMIGIIKSDSCNWKTPFKEGKSIIKATFSRDGQETMDATITIEGKNEKIIILFEIAKDPNKKIRVTADKFEEKI